MIDSIHEREGRARSFTIVIPVLDEVVALRVADANSMQLGASSAAKNPPEPHSFAVVAR